MSSSAEPNPRRVAIRWVPRHGRHACRAPLWMRPDAPAHEILGRPLIPSGGRELPASAVAGRRLATLRQEHGTRIHRAEGNTTWVPPAGDGLSSSDPRWILGLQTADCLPILLADTARGVVAALHAGWKGSAAGIVLGGLEHLEREYGTRTDQIEAVLGPCVGGCCYEVGEDVREAFRRGPLANVSQFSPMRRDRWTIDLAQVNALALIRAGVTPERLQILDACTRCANHRLHSYRAEGAGVGRNWSLLSPDGSSLD